MRYSRILTIVLLMLSALAVSSSAAVYYVDGSMADNSGNGLSWAAAKKTIQAAIDTASSGSEVHVKGLGTSTVYNEHVTMKVGVSVYGGYSGTGDERSITEYVTVIDGTGKDNSVVTAWSATSATVIDGFTIQNGVGRLSTNRFGGGIECSGSLTISHNIIQNNTATFGGGIRTHPGGSPVIEYNTIQSNKATWGAGIYMYDGTCRYNTITQNEYPDSTSSTYGGGIYNGAYCSSTTISNNTITNNKATLRGGGLEIAYATPVISNNTITGNEAVSDSSSTKGGGICCMVSSPVISDNVISGNEASSSVSTGYGGGIHSDMGTPTIQNNTISSNTATTNGGGINCGGVPDSTEAVVTNNQLTDNDASYGGGLHCSSGAISIKNNVFSGNHATSQGGGIYCNGNTYTVSILNNSITGNTADSRAGAICSQWSIITLANNTIAGNTSDTYAALYLDGTPTVLSNNIVAFNSPAGIRMGNSCTLTFYSNDVYSNNGVNYYNITDQTGSNGNISVAPGFVGSGDYHLTFDSPCIDAGDDLCAPNVDLEDHVRPQDGNGDDVAVSDIGAYESPDTFAPSVTVAKAESQSDPTIASPIHFTVTFSEPVFGFSSSGVVLDGSAAPTISEVTDSGDHSTYNVAVSGMTDRGSVTVSIFADAAHDAFGNGNTASTTGLSALSMSVAPHGISAAGQMLGLMDFRTLDVMAASEDSPANSCNYNSYRLIPPSGADYHVDNNPGGNGSDTGNTGEDWNQPFATIQHAIDVASAAGGGEIWVAAGNYPECIELESGVRLYGGFYHGQTDTNRNLETQVTTLDGSGVLASVVRIPANASSNTVIDGFTITGGCGTSYSGYFTFRMGGGICCDRGSGSIISHNVITQNACVLQDDGAYGGGIYCEVETFPVIAHNTITQNGSVDACNAGGGIYSYSYSAVVIADNVISYNKTSGGGGGIVSESAGKVCNNLLEENEAFCGAGMWFDNWRGDPTMIVNNVLKGNSGFSSLDIYLPAGSTIANNTIVGTNDGAGMWVYDTQCTIANNIISGNASSITGYSPTAVLSHNCIFGNTVNDCSGVSESNSGDIHDAPELAEDGYHLTAGSPCIDQGVDFTDAIGVTDIDGQARKTGGYVDIGADEYVDTTPPTIPVVVDDGVYQSPLTALHAAWSANDPESGITEYQYAIGTSPSDPGAGNYLVEWTSVGSDTSVTRELTMSYGTTYYFYVKAINGIGLSSAVGCSDGITPIQEFANIADLPALVDGTAVRLTGKVVSAGTATILGGFYMQEPDGASPQAGIKVRVSNVVVDDRAVVTVDGLMNTEDGERVIDATSVNVTGSGAAVSGLLVGSASNLANAHGLLVWTHAIISLVDGSYQLDNRMRLSTSGLVNPPAITADGSTYSVTGIAVSSTSGPRLLLTRSPTQTCDTTFTNADAEMTCVTFSISGNVMTSDTDGSGGVTGCGGAILFENQATVHLPCLCFGGFLETINNVVAVEVADCHDCVNPIDITPSYPSWYWWNDDYSLYKYVQWIQTTGLHNGKWVLMQKHVFVSEYYDDAEPPNLVTEGAEAKNCVPVEIDNLQITEPTGRQILIHKTRGETLNIHVALHDGVTIPGGGADTTVNVYIYRLPLSSDIYQRLVRTLTATVDRNGSADIAWDTLDKNGQPCDLGCYAYRVEAQHLDPSWVLSRDEDGTLHANRTGPLEGGDSDYSIGGYFVQAYSFGAPVMDNGDGTITGSFTYNVGFNNPTNTCELKIYGPDLGEIKTQQLDNTQGVHTVDVTFPIPKGGSYWLTTYATDSNRNNKCHRNSPSLVDGIKVCVPEITFLQPTGVVGGKVGVQVQVKMAADFDAPPAMSEHEDTELHPWEWTSDNFDTYGMTSDSTITGTVKTTVYTIPWDTTQVHNGRHILRAKCYGTGGLEIVKEYSVEVKNLVVTNVTPEYLKYDPDTGVENTINYTLSDACECAAAQQTTVTVDIFASDQTLVRTETFVKTAAFDGLTYSYIWDGKDGDQNVMPRGVYLYKISATQSADCQVPLNYHHTDSDCEKSDWDITETFAQTLSVDQSSGLRSMRVGFTVSCEDAPTASAAQIQVFDPDIGLLTSRELIATPELVIPLCQRDYFPDFSLMMNKSGVYVFLVSVRDANERMDKAHRQRSLLQKNIRSLNHCYHLLIDPGHGGPSGPGLNYGTHGCYYDKVPDGVTPGSNRYEWDEKDMVLDLGYRFPPLFFPQDDSTLHLQQWIDYYVQTELSRASDANMTIGERKEWVRIKREKYTKEDSSTKLAFVSLHCNGHQNDWNSDNVVIYNDNNDIALADAVYAGLTANGDFYLPYRPNQQRSNLGVLDERLKVPAILIEVATLTRPEEEDWTHPDLHPENLQALAQRIMDGVLNYFVEN